MMPSQITAANRHLLATGQRAVAYATGALLARLIRDEHPKCIYVRNAAERRSRGLELSSLNFLESPLLVAGGTGAFHSLLMQLAESHERAELELFMRSIARRTQHAAERHCRPIAWQGSQDELREVVRLCRLYQQPEPGPVRTVDALTWSMETYLATEEMVDTIAASGCRVQAPAELIERVKDAVGRWLRSLDMDPESADGRASCERVLRDDLPRRVFQEAKTLGDLGRAEYLTSSTLVSMLADRFPELAKKVENRLGGTSPAPVWWANEWVTIDVDPDAAGTRVLTLCNELLLTAMRMHQAGSSDFLRVFFEPNVLGDREAEAGVELLLRQGRKYLIGVVEMGRGMAEIPASHLSHISSFFTDRPLAGGTDQDNDGVWYTTAEMERSYRLSVNELKASDQTWGHQLVESGHFRAQPSVNSGSAGKE